VSDNARSGKSGITADQVRSYVNLSIAEKLGILSNGYFKCNCFGLYLELAENNNDSGLAAREILAGYEWDDCPNPRCPECTEGLYLEIQRWKPMIVNGDLRKRWK